MTSEKSVQSSGPIAEVESQSQNLVTRKRNSGAPLGRMAPPMKKRTLEGDVPRSPSKKVKTAKPARWTVRDDDALRAAVESGREPHLSLIHI